MTGTNSQIELDWSGESEVGRIESHVVRIWLILILFFFIILFGELVDLFLDVELREIGFIVTDGLLRFTLFGWFHLRLRRYGCVTCRGKRERSESS